MFTDQRWCDHVPALFERVRVLQDEGFNLASWNVAHRPVTIDDRGVIRAAGRPLRFFHVTKLGTVGRSMLERNAGDQRPVFELIKRYERLLAFNAAGTPDGWWAYGCYADGTRIPRAHRRLYRGRPDLRAHFPDLYAVGPHSLMQTLNALPPT